MPHSSQSHRDEWGFTFSGQVPYTALPWAGSSNTFCCGKDARSLERNLLIGGSVEIVRVRVLAVTYSDRITWQADGDTTCSVQPSHYILTASR